MYYIVNTEKGLVLTTAFAWIKLEEVPKGHTLLAAKKLEHARAVCAWVAEERTSISPYSERRLSKAGIKGVPREDTLVPTLERMQCLHLLELGGKQGRESFQQWQSMHAQEQKNLRGCESRKEEGMERKTTGKSKVCTIRSTRPYDYTPLCVKARETLKMMRELCEMMDQRERQAQSSASEADKTLVDLMHIAEFSNLSVADGYRVYKRVQKAREARRRAKDDLSVLEMLAPMFSPNTKKAVDAALGKLDHMAARLYVTRAMDAQEVAQVSKNILVAPQGAEETEE